jgi:hypothetical protein
VERARGRQALGLLALQAARPADAQPHHQIAREQLERLTEESPEELSYQLALAECNERLAEIAGAARPNEYKQFLGDAKRIYKQLEARSPDGERYRARRMELELRSAVDAGFQQGAQHLKEAAQLRHELDDNWPSDPTDVYLLVCRLSQSEPILAPASADAPAREK